MNKNKYFELFLANCRTWMCQNMDINGFILHCCCAFNLLVILAMNPGWWAVWPVETSFPTEQTYTHSHTGERVGRIEVRVKLVPLPSGMTSTHWCLAAKESNAPNRIHRGHRCVCVRNRKYNGSHRGEKCVYPCVCHALFGPLWHVCPTGVYLLLLFSPGSPFLSAFYPLICPPLFLFSLAVPPPHPPSFLLLSGYPNWQDTVPSVIFSVASETAVTPAGNSRI